MIQSLKINSSAACCRGIKPLAIYRPIPGIPPASTKSLPYRTKNRRPLIKGAPRPSYRCAAKALLNQIQLRHHPSAAIAPCCKTYPSACYLVIDKYRGSVPDSIGSNRFSLNVDDLHAFPNAGRESEHYTFFRINCSQAGRCTRCFLKEESLTN